MIRKFKKEILAVLFGIAIAYAWQLCFLGICYISNPDSVLIMSSDFIPSINIQLSIMPMVSWFLMGFLQVNWIKKWIHITCRGFALLIPFMLIAGIAVITSPSLWTMPIFWISNVLISLVCTFTLFKPLLHFRYSNGK